MSLRVVRGTRVGAELNGPTEIDRGSRAERAEVEFWCAAEHRTAVVFSAEAEWPDTWPCSRCDDLASRVHGAEALATHRARGAHKTHYEFMMMRRTEEDGEQLLAEALQDLRRQRRPS